MLYIPVEERNKQSSKEIVPKSSVPSQGYIPVAQRTAIPIVSTTTPQVKPTRAYIPVEQRSATPAIQQPQQTTPTIPEILARKETISAAPETFTDKIGKYIPESVKKFVSPLLDVREKIRKFVAPSQSELAEQIIDERSSQNLPPLSTDELKGEIRKKETELGLVRLGGDKGVLADPTAFVGSLEHLGSRVLKSVLQKLTKETAPEVIESILKKEVKELPAEYIPAVRDSIAKATTKNQVVDILNSAATSVGSNVPKYVRVADRAKVEAPKASIVSLEEEARKYKSAEEFVRNQKESPALAYLEKLKEGENYKITKAATGGDEDRALARIFQQNIDERKVPEYVLNDFYSKAGTAIDMEARVPIAPQNGVRGTHVMQFYENPKVSQLTDTWNKVNTKVTSESPLAKATRIFEDAEKSVDELAKKYGIPSAELYAPKQAIDRTMRLPSDLKEALTARNRAAKEVNKLFQENETPKTILNRIEKKLGAEPVKAKDAPRTDEPIEIPRSSFKEQERANKEYLKVTKKEAEADLPSEQIMSVRQAEKNVRKMYVPHKEKLEEALSEIITEFDLAKAGEQIPIYKDGYIVGWKGVSSTFPQWLPAALRNKKEMMAAIENIRSMYDLKYPDRINSIRRAKLTDAIFDRIDQRVGVDTKSLRKDIVKKYTPEARKEFKSEKALNSFLERGAKKIDKIIGDEEAKKARIERVQKAEQESAKRIADEQAYKARYDELVKRAHNEAITGKRGLLTKLKEAFAPVKYLAKDTQEIYKTWKQKRILAKELANEEMEKFKNMPDQEFADIVEYQAGKKTPWIKEAFDSLFTEAKRRGLEFRYKEDYLPQVYAEKPEEVKEALIKYLKDEGLDAQTIQSYVEKGEELPEKIALRLRLNPTFIKARTFPDYVTAMKYGLTPRYDNPVQLIAYYREEMEKAIANREFLEALKKEAKIIPSELAPANWQTIKIPFAPADAYKAEPRLAEVLNDVFRDDSTLTIFQEFVKKGAWLSKKAQELALSGGVPRSTINFYAIGQTIKQMTLGDFKSIPAFLRANFTKASLEFFEKNKEYLKMMSDEGVNLGDKISNYDKVYENLSKKWGKSARSIIGAPFKKDSYKGFGNLIGDSFDKVFNEKTFGSFMPQLYTQTFKGAYKAAIRKGSTTEAAKKLAAEITKKTFGLIEDAGRLKTTEDTISTLFFAPKFRETIIRTLFNTGKAGYDFFKKAGGIKGPLDERLVNNRRLLAGMAITYATYNIINKQLNGHYMWDNEGGREFALRIPMDDGKVVYVEFMPSFLSFARNIASSAINFVKGDWDVAIQKAGTVLSMPLKITSEIFTNRDYFGRAIYKDTDSTPTKIKKVGAYLGLQTSHPYLRELTRYIQYDQPLDQTLIYASELPIKFGSEEKEAKSAYYEMLDRQKEVRAKARERMMPTYEKVQKMAAEGKISDAKTILDSLSSEDYEVYKDIRTIKKREETIKSKPRIFKVIRDVDELVKQGKKEDAQKIVNGLSDADYKIYKSLRESMKKASE